MANISIPYQSFCWVIGTTSFRTAKLNLKIEAQLLLLDEFYNEVIKKSSWNWNNELQEKYYDFMKDRDFLIGDAKRKDKDAREKTSGLVDIGLITEDRLITEAGRELLKITSSGIFETDNVFNINRDSFVYLKQLLKTSIDVSGSIVRPFIAVVKCLTELEFLSYDEFTYFVPLIIDDESAKQIISDIKLYREGQINLEEIIYKRLMQMDNYKLAQEEFITSDVDENLICLIGMNRKSRNYDKPYYKLYQSIKSIFLEGKSDYELLLNSAKNINQKPGILWRNLIFKTNIIKENLTQLMHGYKTGIVDIAECYIKLFGNMNNIIPNNYKVNVDDILSKTVDGKEIVNKDKYPLLNRTLVHSFTYLFLRLLIEKKLVSKYNIDTESKNGAKQLGQIISKAFPENSKNSDDIKNRVFLTTKKTLLNEFNHFEGNMSIFQPAIDITDHMLGKEKTDILAFINKL